MSSDFSSYKQQLSSFFLSKNIRINPTWIQALLTKLSSDGLLTSTNVNDFAIRQFLHSNIRHSVLPVAPLLPDSITGKSVISGVLVQVVECHEIGFSLTQKLDKLEAYEERQKPVSRRLIRLEEVTGDGEPAQDLVDNQQVTQMITVKSAEDDCGPVGKKMVKVMLEDAKGNRLYAIDQKPIDQFRVGMTLGAKLFLMDTPVVYGVLVLRPKKVEWLGGAVDEWNSGTGNVQQQIKEVRADLQSRLSQFPVMNTRQRQEASRLVQEQEEGEYYEEVGDAEMQEPPRRTTRGRGSSARGRGATLGSRRARARGRES